MSNNKNNEKKTWWQTVGNINQAKIVLFGVPYDKTASFQKGTVDGPREFRDKMEFAAETWSPHAKADLGALHIYDAGDVPLSNKAKPSLMNQMVGKFVDTILNHNVKTLMIGGEHSVTYPVFRSHFQHHPDLCLIHFDAHTDLRDDFYNEPFSHACVVKKCIDLIGPGRTFQFGIRSGTMEEFAMHDQGITYIEQDTVKTVAQIIKRIYDKPIYITIDIDVLDPAFAPGTGTPEAGGISYLELINALRILSQVPNVVGIDIVELAPRLDPSNRTTALTIKLAREILLMFWGSNVSKG